MIRDALVPQIQTNLTLHSALFYYGISMAQDHIAHSVFGLFKLMSVANHQFELF